MLGKLHLHHLTPRPILFLASSYCQLTHWIPLQLVEFLAALFPKLNVYANRGGVTQNSESSFYLLKDFASIDYIMQLHDMPNARWSNDATGLSIRLGFNQIRI